MINSKRLKEIRLKRGLTQKQLAIKSGITDAAIRNYELGLRSPNYEQLKKIALTLEVNPSALKDFSIMTNDDLFHTFFALEDDLKLQPVVEEGNSPMLLSKDVEFTEFIIKWDEMIKKLKREEITQEEFEEWKLSVPKKIGMNQKINLDILNM